MSDEILETTPEQEVETTETQDSAQTEIQEETVTSENGEDSTAEQPKKSKGVQKRIDELTAQRHQVEREKETWQQQAEYWRILAMQTPQPQQTTQPTPPAVKPSLDQFENYDDYISSLAKWEAKAIIEEQQKVSIAQQNQYQKQQSLQSFSQREAQFAESTPDYFQVSRNNSVPITDAMLSLMAGSDLGPQLAYHLGKNPDLAKRIAYLDPVNQAREFGRLEANLARPVAKKETKAPAPIDPNKGGVSPVTDMSKLSVDQWMEARRKQLNS